MAFDVSALNAYVNEHRSELMSAAVLAFKSSQYFQPMPETKGPTTLNLLSAPVTFQSGESCGFNASGNVSFTQRVLTPGALTVNESFCPDALRKYYMQNEVNIGAGRETMPFEEKVLALIVKKIGEAMEVAFWQGDKTNGTGNNAFFDGLHTILKADCGANPTVIPSANKVTAGSSDTIYDRVKALAEMVPDAMGNKMNFYMSTKNFRKLSLIITNSNMYHYQRDIDSENLTMIFPGTDLKVIGVGGLAGVDAIWGLNPEEVAYGFDKQDDVESFDFWFSKDNQEFRFVAKWLAGVQYSFPQDVLAGIPYGGL